MSLGENYFSSVIYSSYLALAQQFRQVSLSRVNHVCKALLPRDGWATADVHTCWPHYKPSLTQPRKLQSFLFPSCSQTHAKQQQHTTLITTRVTVCTDRHPWTQPCLPDRHRRRTLGHGAAQTLSPREASLCSHWSSCLWDKRERSECMLSSNKTLGAACRKLLKGIEEDGVFSSRN